MSKFLPFCSNPDCDEEDIDITDVHVGGVVHCPKCGCEMNLNYDSNCGTYVEDYELKDG